MLVVLVCNIPVHIDGEVKKKIISTLQNLPFRDGESVIVLFWAAEEIKKYIFVLTTTFQPFLLSGNNKELHAYRLSCLYNKLYVYRGAKEEAAFGLAGMAYLYCTPQQTQNVHEYLRDHSPTCEHASFTKKWGSYAVPVIDANKCVGVLEVITDTPRDYSNDITVAKEVLEHAGLQTTMRIDSTLRTYVYPKERSRITFTSPINSYCCLNKYFGLSSICAAKALEGVIKHPHKLHSPTYMINNFCVKYYHFISDLHLCSLRSTRKYLQESL
ncbi:putative GAF-like domain superfamily protein [Helianthus debilis subsp. tardiflorus]